MTHDVEAAVAATFREEWGRVVATLIRFTGDFDIAEECAQDAFALAVDHWRREGVPRNPGAWLTTTAKNRAINRLRRDRAGETKLREAAMLAPPDDALPEDIEDDRLRLIFTCCHPALALDAQVALTLRTLAGLTTAEIARAFLAPEPTMAQRLVRAKRKIREAGIPYRVPPAELMPERSEGVLAVLYLLFNEGYSASSGADLVRTDLCAEAIRLGRLLVALMPNDGEAGGLLALMLFQDSRRATRIDAAGVLVPLDEQDRTRWNEAAIDEGQNILDASLTRGHFGPYQIQAAIAACHATATSAHETDWVEIAGLYAELTKFLRSPVVELNRAVAIAMADGPQAGLRLLDRLDAEGTLVGYHLLPAARADLLRRLGRSEDAAAAYRQALALVTTEPERRYLERRLNEVAPL